LVRDIRFAFERSRELAEILLSPTTLLQRIPEEERERVAEQI